MNIDIINKLATTFGRVETHKYIGEIIQAHSTNKNSISSYVYKNVIFDNKIKIADLGCGYGRCINYIKNIVPRESECLGIDLLENNQKSYLKLAHDAGFKGEFKCGSANRISEYPDNYFDLILCNYSLYFFVDNLPTIVSKLKSDGLFITITHSSCSLKELLTDLQKVLKLNHLPTWNELGSEQVLDNFNAENGYEILKKYFSHVQQINYKNNLEFTSSSFDKLLDLLNFKKITLIHHNDYADFILTEKFDNLLKKQLNDHILKYGNYILNKDDTIFHCRNPRSIS